MSRPSNRAAQFALGKKRSWLWAITPDTITSIALPPRAEIETSARKIYELLTVPSTEERHDRVTATSSHRRGRCKIPNRGGGDEPYVVRGRRFHCGEWKGKRLAIVASGALEYAPFAVLPLPETEGRREGEDGRRGDGATGRRGDRATEKPHLARRPVAPSPSFSLLITKSSICHQLLRSPSSAAKPPGGRRPRRCWPPWPIQSSTQMIHAWPWQPQEKPLRTA